MSPAYTPVKALFIIVSSLYLITGGVYKSRLFHRSVREQPSPAYLRKIIQTGPQKEALKTVYLAELVGLSSDLPTLTDAFDIDTATQRVLTSPVIKKSSLQVIEPDILYIDYTVRYPIALLDDFQNTAIDEEGYPFPIFPFFTPKNLTTLYLGIENLEWNQPIRNPNLSMALEWIKLLPHFPFSVKKVDFSKASAPTLGTREVVFTIEEKKSTLFLRLTPERMEQELTNYLELRTTLGDFDYIIDLKTPQTAFITPFTQSQEKGPTFSQKILHSKEKD